MAPVDEILAAAESAAAAGGVPPVQPLPDAWVEVARLCAARARDLRHTDMPDGTDPTAFKDRAAAADHKWRRASRTGNPSWRLLLTCRFWAVACAPNRAALRRALIELAADTLAWAIALDKRQADAP